MIEHLTTSVIVVDSEFAIVSANSAAEHLLQASRLRLRGTPVTDWFEEAEALRDGLQRCRDTTLACAHLFRLRKHSDQREDEYVDVRLAPFPPAADHILIEFVDATSRRRFNRDAALMHQHDAGRLMARQLAHEIKNPLGGLRGAAQLLQRQADDHRLTEYTDIIIGEADRMATLVDRLLGPGNRPDKSPLNIHEVLEQVLRLVAVETGERIEWRRDYDPSLPPVSLDRDQMVQAVLNLVSNATAAALSEQERGCVTLRTRAATNETIGAVRHRLVALIEIEDNGPGIDPEIRESIFFPLVTGRSDGTGIGLPLSQDLINRHGGLIEFTSEPGRTVFAIRLPIQSHD